MLTVVQYEQQTLGLQAVNQRLHTMFYLLFDVQHLSHRLWNQRRVDKRGQLHKPHSIRELP